MNTYQPNMLNSFTFTTPEAHKKRGKEGRESFVEFIIPSCKGDCLGETQMNLKIKNTVHPTFQRFPAKESAGKPSRTRSVGIPWGKRARCESKEGR